MGWTDLNRFFGAMAWLDSVRAVGCSFNGIVELWILILETHACRQQETAERNKEEASAECAKALDHEEQDPGDSRIPGADEYAKCVC